MLGDAVGDAGAALGDALGDMLGAMVGDTVLTALMLEGAKLRDFEFGAGGRAGFCLMGACQDCWVRQERGGAIRACTSYVADGMRLLIDGA